ncbi:hypothetical protein [Mucisphaera calidilacus]|uniref:Uncharacterized protein n=1 Tax=Mucisphaera calidilacus TaxID=2527982 RepID=A0A518BTI8_9BACT|nr:hypothetical protein [Mucisphaera calidilacus]QDU70288.1 hypothetical protein Pan265_01110 [Mucisphaera calidilacus]
MHRFSTLIAATSLTFALALTGGCKTNDGGGDAMILASETKTCSTSCDTPCDNGKAKTQSACCGGCGGESDE